MPRAKKAAGEKPKKTYKYKKASFTVGKKPDGTPDRRWVRGKTVPERDEKLREAKRLYSRGLELGELTVREWSKRWMSIYKANTTANQKAHYQAKLDHDILPAIGNMRIKDVRASHLQELLNKYKGGKKGTVEKVRGAIRQLFADAEYEGIIERNPAIRLDEPETEEEPRRPLTSKERQAVLKVAETHPRGPFYLTMLYCGPRVGECAAFIVGDIDFDKKRIAIDKALSYRKNIGVLSSTKAAKLRKKRIVKNNEEIGARTAPIPDILLPILKKLCEGKDAAELLFPKSDGEYATKQTLTWWWKSFARQCHITAGAKLYRNAIKYETSPFGEELTSHYLRHTYATDLYAAGIDEKARKEFLGHASKDVTDTYTAMSAEAFDRAAGLLNDYLNGEKWKPSESEQASDEKQEIPVHEETPEDPIVNELGDDLSKFVTAEDLFKKLGI